MTRKGALGGAALLALVLACLAIGFAPRIVAEQVRQEAAARGVELAVTVDSLSLGVSIERMVVERSGATLVCTGGRATMTPRAIVRMERRLSRVYFEECVVSRTETTDQRVQPPAEHADDRSPLSRLFGGLDSLVEIEHLSIERMALRTGDEQLTVTDLNGRLSPGTADVEFSVFLDGPARIDGNARVRANADSLSLESDAALLFADSDLSIARATLGSDGALSLAQARVTTPIANAEITSLQVSPNRAVRVEDVQVEFSPSAPAPSEGRGSLALLPLLTAAVGVPAGTELSIDSTNVVSFVRSLQESLTTTRPILEPTTAEEEQTDTVSPHQLLERSALLRHAVVAFQESVGRIPFDLVLANVRFTGVPGCSEFEIQSVHAAPGELTGHIECDGMGLLLNATPDSTNVGLERVQVQRFHPAARGLVGLSIAPTLTDDATTIHIESTFTELGAYHEAVSHSAVELSGTLALDAVVGAATDEPEVVVHLSGQFGDVPFDGTITTIRDRSTWSLRAEGGVSDPTPCSTMWEATPPGLIPHLGDANVLFAGSAAPRLRATYEFGNSDSFDIRQDGFMGDCSVQSIDEPYDPRVLLADDYVFTVTQHATVPIDVGPGAYGYEPIDGLPSYVPALMYLSEEIAFFDNPGVSLMLMRRAVRMNLRERRYVYGGSTVTQQLVKNLFFGREKTLARKFEEAIVVWAMEQWLTKERILELYLNCVEFAPDVYGITAAALHYFDKHPSELTPLEAAFLAALKPAPSRGERHRRRGHSPDTGWWHERLLVLLQRLVEYGPYIDQAEVEHYAPYIVAFPTSPNFVEVDIEVTPRPKWTISETFIEARARFESQ